MFHKNLIIFFFILFYNCGLNRYSDYEICERRAKNLELTLIPLFLTAPKNEADRNFLILLAGILKINVDTYLDLCKDAAKRGAPLP
jgi:hypothetical protein